MSGTFKDSSSYVRATTGCGCTLGFGRFVPIDPSDRMNTLLRTSVRGRPNVIPCNGRMHLSNYCSKVGMVSKNVSSSGGESVHVGIVGDFSYYITCVVSKKSSCGSMDSIVLVVHQTIPHDLDECQGYNSIDAR